MKKFFAVLGLIVSILFVYSGYTVLNGDVDSGTDTASSAGILYDSGYASFGADFYTYVTNNAAEAAAASRTVAANLHHMAQLFLNVVGYFMIGIGLLSFCAFGVALCDKKKVEYIQAPVLQKNSTNESSIATN